MGLIPITFIMKLKSKTNSEVDITDIIAIGHGEKKETIMLCLTVESWV